LKLRLSVKTFY